MPFDPDVIERDGQHVEGCGIDHDPEQTDCYTRDDWLAEATWSTTA